MVRWARKQRPGPRSRWPGESREGGPGAFTMEGQAGRRLLEFQVALKLGREWEQPREGCVHVCGGGETFKHRRNGG